MIGTNELVFRDGDYCEKLIMIMKELPASDCLITTTIFVFSVVTKHILHNTVLLAFVDFQILLFTSCHIS